MLVATLLLDPWLSAVASFKVACSAVVAWVSFATYGANRCVSRSIMPSSQGANSGLGVVVCSGWLQIEAACGFTEILAD